MVSDLTYTSQCVTWELEESIDKGNALIAMGFRDGPNSLLLPEPLRRLKIQWSLWDYNKLAGLIKAAP